MIRNYFKIAWRNLLLNKTSSFINIFGLALGIAVTLIIGLWIIDEFNYNNYFKNKDRIARVMQHQTVNGSIKSNETIPLALEFQLRENFSDVFKYIIMSSGNNSRYLSVDGKVISTNGRFMQIDAPALLNLNIIEGQKKGLQETNAILISKTTATTLFGNDNPLGKTIISDNKYPMIVRGVYSDIPSNNSFSEMHFIMPFKHWMSSRWAWLDNQDSDWDHNSFDLFVELTENVDIGIINNRIENIKKDNDPRGDKFNPRLFIFPMTKWYLQSTFKNGIQIGGRIDNVWLFGIIGLFVLILASINFMNLSTARSEKRSLEVGIRKSIGSSRRQLIYQFLSESFLVVVCSFMFAISIVLLFLTTFNELAGKEITFPWTHSSFWIVSIIFIILTTLLSGSYPALYLSSFKPIKVLNRTFKVGKNTTLPRKILVITQFTVSTILIIGTLIVKKQIDFTKNRPLGIDKNQLIEIPTSSHDFSNKYELIRNELLTSGAVTKMSWGTSPSIQTWNHSSGYEWEHKPKGFNDSFAIMGVSYDYVDAVGMKITQGRNFSREFPSDSNAVILNRTAVKYMGLKKPIGKYIRYTEPNPRQQPLKIIGVVDDVINKSVYDPILPQMYQFGYGFGGFYHVKLNPNQSTNKNLSIIEEVFKSNFPNLPFTYNFLDERYALMFSAEERIASLSSLFTILAVLISCLGLFGLVSFLAEQRTKEIGVRKILGASISQLWLLLSKDFIKLVIIALLVASPIAYYIMSQWLQKFNYRTTVSWDVFVIACSGALIIALVTVSFQAIKAAISNPVKSLRTE